MKKVVLLLLLLAGTFSLAFPQQSGICGENVVWTYSDGTLTIKPAEGTSGGEMKNYTYTTYTDRPWDELNISKVIIEKGVTTIGAYAFYRCSGLTSLTIGESVTTIGQNAFYNCSGLTSVTIPNSVTSIGNYAFYGCTGLVSVYYTDNLVQWCGIKFGSWWVETGWTLYINNVKVTDLLIPEGVTSIGQYAFYGCSGLTSVTIGESVTTIGERAFNECSRLREVPIGNSVRNI